ncbi:MAG: hypothetical protein JST00_28035 [Deltaproteobacteria bacterium]|nr:hypothetical protein [Deltaproteobacteria bacterium]
MMNERRQRRSAERDAALGFLLESVMARSDVSAIAIVDGRGFVVAGKGTDQELVILGTVAAPVAAGIVSRTCERLTEGTDVISKKMSCPGGPLYLAALGSRVRRMNDAVCGALRILAA